MAAYLAGSSALTLGLVRAAKAGDEPYRDPRVKLPVYPQPSGWTDDGGFDVFVHPPTERNGQRWHVRWGYEGQHLKTWQSPLALNAFVTTRFQPPVEPS